MGNLINRRDPSRPPLEIRYVEDGSIKSAVIDPLSTNFSEKAGEVQLWSCASETKGIIRKKSLKVWLLLTYCAPLKLIIFYFN